MILTKVSLKCLYCNKAKAQIISGMKKVCMSLGTEVIKKKKNPAFVAGDDVLLLHCNTERERAKRQTCMIV